MTLTQLEAFVLVARLGSVKAAARTLGVSEPAVSSAIAALRQQLGDSLLERSNGTMVLTAGGRRLVPLASQMVGLAVEAEAAIRQARGAPDQLRIVATSDVAESVAPALVEAFRARAKAVDVSLGVAAAHDMAALVQERLADVALGPKLSADAEPLLDCEPLFRYRLMFFAAGDHRLAGHPTIEPGVLTREVWLVGPGATEPGSPVHELARRLGVPDERLRVFPTHAAALAAGEQGEGVVPAVAHTVLADAERSGLTSLAVRGTPLELLWHTTMLARDRRTPAAASFRRFVATPLATQAMHAPLRGVPASRFRPPVYVTIWN